MSIEKFWAAVPPQLFTSDGNAYGIVTVADSSGFKVKQLVFIAAVGKPNIAVQIKRFISCTQFYVGPPGIGRALSSRSDLSGYTVAAGAYIYAEEQPKVILTPDDIVQAVYDQEPTVAIRSVIVDSCGDYYNDSNPLPVAFDGTVEIGTVEVKGTNGNYIEPNPDGSLNVNIIETPVTGQTVISIYNQVLNVVSGVTTTLINYTVPVGYTAVLERVSASGENIGRYDILYNNNLFDTRRTMFGGDLTTDFDYTTGSSNGFVLNSGDNIIVQVLHNRPYTGDFNARLQVLQIA